MFSFSELSAAAASGQASRQQEGVQATGGCHSAFAGDATMGNGLVHGISSGTTTEQGFGQTSSTRGGSVTPTTGGFEGVATGDCSTVSGGHLGAASGTYSAVSGGRHGKASGESSSIVDGHLGTASAVYAGSFSFAPFGVGGHENAASGTDAAVSGGQKNIASGQDSSVSGGTSSVASGPFAAASGAVSTLPLAATSVEPADCDMKGLLNPARSAYGRAVGSKLWVQDGLQKRGRLAGVGRFVSTKALQAVLAAEFDKDCCLLDKAAVCAKQKVVLETDAERVTLASLAAVTHLDDADRELLASFCNSPAILPSRQYLAVEALLERMRFAVAQDKRSLLKSAAPWAKKESAAVRFQEGPPSVVTFQHGKGEVFQGMEAELVGLRKNAVECGLDSLAASLTVNLKELRAEHKSAFVDQVDMSPSCISPSCKRCLAVLADVASCKRCRLA